MSIVMEYNIASFGIADTSENAAICDLLCVE